MSISPLIPAAFGFYLKVIGDSFSYWIAGIVFTVLVAINFVVQYLVHIAPYRDSTSDLDLLAIVGERIVDQGRADGINLRLNILLIHRPVKRLFLRHFHVCWGIGMKYQPDGTAEFSISKGVCGQVVESRKGKLVDMTLPEHQGNWGFSNKELARFPAFTAIWSLPIFELNKQGSMTGNIIGTVNLDSISPAAYATLTGNDLYVMLFDDLRDVVSKVTS